MGTKRAGSMMRLRKNGNGGEMMPSVPRKTINLDYMIPIHKPGIASPTMPLTTSLSNQQAIAVIKMAPQLGTTIYYAPRVIHRIKLGLKMMDLILFPLQEQLKTS